VSANLRTSASELESDEGTVGARDLGFVGSVRLHDSRGRASKLRLHERLVCVPPGVKKCGGRLANRHQTAIRRGRLASAELAGTKRPQVRTRMFARDAGNGLGVVQAAVQQ